MKRTSSQTIAFELLSLLVIPVILLVNSEDKALIIRLDEKDIKNSDAIVADLHKNEQQRSESYLLAPKQRASLKYTDDSNPVTGLILDKGLSYVLLRPEDAERFKLKKDAEEGEKTSKFLLIPEDDLKSYNRSDYHRSSYQTPVKHNTISVEVVDGDSNSEYDLEPKQYSTRTKKRSPEIKEIISVTSPYDSNSGERRPIERRHRNLLPNAAVTPLSPRPPIAPRSPFLIRHPIPRYYNRGLPYSPYPHPKPEYGPSAPNFAGTRVYHIPPPGPFRGLLSRSPPFYHQGPKYASAPPNKGLYHYTSAVKPLRPPPASGIPFRSGPPPQILYPIASPKPIAKPPVPSYYSDLNSYAQKGGLTPINGERRPSYYVDSGPNPYNKNKQLPPPIRTNDYSTSHSPAYYGSSDGKPSSKGYAPTSYSHSQPPPPPSESADYSPPSHPDMYANYKPSKRPYSTYYEHDSPPSHGDGPSSYGNSYKKYSPVSPDYSGEHTHEPHPYHHKDSDSSYEPPVHYNKDLPSSYETPVDYHKDSYSYHRPPNGHPKEIHPSYGPINDHSKETYSPYGQSDYSRDPIQPYDSPRDHVKDTYESPPRDYPKDSHSSYGYPPKRSNEGPSSYHHSSEPTYQPFEKPTYFTEHDAIPSPGPYPHPESFEPFRKSPTPESEKHLEYPQSLEISSEVPDYHKAKKNYEPVRPPPKSSMTTKKLHPPLPPARKAQSSDEEDSHYDHHKGNNHKDNHYDHHYHYDYDRIPPVANQNFNDFPEYSPQSQPHSKTSTSTSYSHSDHNDAYPHSGGERTYYSSPNTPNYYSEPKPHSLEEYGEENYHDKPTAASKSYTKSQADHGYQPQTESEHQYKSHIAPAKLKHQYNNPKDRSQYIIEDPPPRTSTKTLPPNSNHPSEDDRKHRHRVRKFRKRPRMKYEIKNPYKSSSKTAHSGVRHSTKSPSKQSIPQARHVSNGKNDYKQTPNNYEDDTSSYEYNDEYRIDESNAAIPGEPGKDYPVMSRAPTSDFSCYNKAPGFYADIENRCQVYYQCSDKGLLQSFLCPNGTIFNQETFVCEWWHNVDCANSERHFSRNNDLYKVPEPKPPKDKQHIPQSRRAGIKKLRYSGPSINSHQPYRDRPVYRPSSRHHQENDYNESRPSADYEPHGSATENKEQYVAHVDDNKGKVSKDHASQKAAKSSNSENRRDFFDAKRMKQKLSVSN